MKTLTESYKGNKTFRSGKVTGNLKIENSNGYLTYKVDGIKESDMVTFDFQDGTPKERIWENYKKEIDDISDKARVFCEENESSLWSY